MEDKKIVLRVIIEIMGSPKDHVEKTMGMVLEKFKKEYKVVKEDLNEATQIKQFWSTFVELEVEIEKIDQMVSICFDYLPSSIEVIDPTNFNIKNQDLSDLMNDLLAKLHRYDMALKNVHAENLLLKKQMKK